MSVLLGGQVEMQHNPQMFCSFDIYHEITEHAALPGTVLGQRTFEKIAIGRLFLEPLGVGGTKHNTPLLMVIGVGKKIQ